MAANPRTVHSDHIDACLWLVHTYNVVILRLLTQVLRTADRNSLNKIFIVFNSLILNIILRKAENHKELRKLVVKSILMPQQSAKHEDR